MLCTNGTHGNAGEIATLIDTIQRQFIKVEEFTHIIYIYIYIYIYIQFRLSIPDICFAFS